MTITVSVMDAAAASRDGFSQFLRNARGLRLLGVHASAAEALRAIPAENPDVVLMDINLARVDGIECARLLKNAAPNSQILLLTVCQDTDRLLKALAAGASGCLLKPVPPARLLQAIREVHAGGSPMSGPIARKVVQSFQHNRPANPEDGPLSHRERQVLQFLGHGDTYQQIGDELGISIDTTRTYIRRIYEKLHVHSRTAAVLRLITGPKARNVRAWAGASPTSGGPGQPPSRMSPAL